MDVDAAGAVAVGGEVRVEVCFEKRPPSLSLMGGGCLATVSFLPFFCQPRPPTFSYASTGREKELFVDGYEAMRKSTIIIIL